MSAGYRPIELKMLLDTLGEEEVKQILSEFCCPLNKDVEDFLRTKAIVFSKQGIAATHLVFASFQERWVLVGYFTLANKIFTIPNPKKFNAKMRSRLSRFATYNKELKRYDVTAPLIAQLGKNFGMSHNQLISGDELLKMACDKIQEIQRGIGGKLAYLECEDVQKLKDFYTSNGFFEFGKRQLDKDELESMKVHSLVQMLKYFS